MKHFFTLLVWVALWGIFPKAQAQNDTHILGFHFKNPKRTKLTLPFRQYNNLIVVSLLVNNKYDTLNFVLDTGVGYTLITDPIVQKRFNLTCLRTVKVSGFGKEEALKACVVQIEQIGLGKHIVAYKQNVVALEKDVLELSAYAGVRIHGLLGYDLFSKFVVQIDYPAQRIILTEPTVYVPKLQKKMQALPISVEEMKPYLLAKTQVGEDSSQKAVLKLLLDTGAGHSLSLDRGTHAIIQPPEKNLPAQLGMTLNGSVEGIIGRINSIQLGSLTLQDVITTFPDSVSIALRSNAQTVFRQGNIGCGLLSRFRLIFDYTHKKLYIKPNRSFKEPFEFSTSGIELIASPPYYNEIKIGGVRPNSPADRVGLRAGDKIMAVEDQLTKNMKLGEVYKLLNQEAGKKISMLVQLAEGNFQVVQLLLENPL